MNNPDRAEKRLVSRKDLCKMLGAGAASLVLGQALSQPDKAAGAPSWQPSWAGESNWPVGPSGEKQTVTLSIGAGQVLVLSNGYTKLFDRDNNPYLYEAPKSDEVIIPVVDGGMSGGSVQMEVNNLFNWKGVANKPVFGQSLTWAEMDILALDRIKEAKKYGANKVTLIQMNLSAPRWLVDATTIHDINAYVSRLESRLGGVNYRIYLPEVGK